MIYRKLLVLTRVNLLWINGRGIQYNIWTWLDGVSVIACNEIAGES